MKREKMIEWVVQIAILASSLGGAYTLLKEHERRLSRVEEKVEHCMTEQGFQDFKRDLRWSSGGRRSP